MFSWIARWVNDGSRGVGVFGRFVGCRDDRSAVLDADTGMPGEDVLSADLVAVEKSANDFGSRGHGFAARDSQNVAWRVVKILPKIGKSEPCLKSQNPAECLKSELRANDNSANAKPLDFQNGNSKKRVVRALKRKHGLSSSPTYQSWLSMNQRCTNPKREDFADYGGRGIRVCKRWRPESAGFIAFVSDMGLRPEGMTLDRKNVDGNYTPANTRWSDRKEQRANRRDSRRG